LNGGTTAHTWLDILLSPSCEILARLNDITGEITARPGQSQVLLGVAPSRQVVLQGLRKTHSLIVIAIVVQYSRSGDHTHICVWHSHILIHLHSHLQGTHESISALSMASCSGTNIGMANALGITDGILDRFCDPAIPLSIFRVMAIAAGLDAVSLVQYMFLIIFLADLVLAFGPPLFLRIHVTHSINGSGAMRDIIIVEVEARTHCAAGLRST
jgi:hypothetical protein